MAEQENTGRPEKKTPRRKKMLLQPPSTDTASSFELRRAELFEQRLRFLQEKYLEALKDAHFNVQATDVVDIQARIDALHEERKRSLPGSENTEETNRDKHLSSLGVAAMEKLLATKVNSRENILMSANQLPIPNSLQIQVSGGHSALIMGVLQEAGENATMERTDVYTIHDQSGNNSDVYIAYVPMAELVTALARNDNTDFRRIVAHNIQQELSGFDMPSQLRGLQMCEVYVQRAQQSGTQEDIAEAQHDVASAKNRVVRAHAVAENTRRFMHLATQSGIDFNEVLPPIPMPGNNRMVPFSDGVLELCQRSLFEGMHTNDQLKTRVNAIIDELNPSPSQELVAAA